MQAQTAHAEICDFNGDGKSDWAITRRANPFGQYNWYIRYNGEENFIAFDFGLVQRDRIIPADYDGDGKADFRVQRPIDTSMIQEGPAIFYTLTATGNISYDYFGLADDRIVPGDYDGDGKTDIALVRGFNISPQQITWYIRYSSGQPDAALDFGQGSNFRFAQGDYDGDGKDDIAYLVNIDDQQLQFAYRPSSNPAEGYRSHPWGIQGDLPAAGYNNR